MMDTKQNGPNNEMKLSLFQNLLSLWPQLILEYLCIFWLVVRTIQGRDGKRSASAQFWVSCVSLTEAQKPTELLLEAPPQGGDRETDGD